MRVLNFELCGVFWTNELKYLIINIAWKWTMTLDTFLCLFPTADRELLLLLQHLKECETARHHNNAHKREAVCVCVCLGAVWMREFISRLQPVLSIRFMEVSSIPPLGPFFKYELCLIYCHIYLRGNCLGPHYCFLIQKNGRQLKWRMQVQWCFLMTSQTSYKKKQELCLKFLKVILCD